MYSYIFLMFLIIIIRCSYIYCGSCHITGKGQCKEADCSSRKLSNVPKDLPDDIIKLDLRRNLIVKLTAKAFISYQNLQILILDENRISYLKENTFAGLEKLNTLSLFGNNLDLNASYHMNIFSPLVSLKTLNIAKNMNKINGEKVFYPILSELHNLFILEVDLSKNPVFKMSGLNNLTRLNTLMFDFCYLDKMTNNTFLDMPATIVDITFIGCTINSVADANFLRPFPSLRSLQLKRVCVDYDSALKILYPFENKTMNEIKFEEVNPGYCDGSVRSPYAVIVTANMMKYLQNICVRKLSMIKNGIVDFKPNSLLFYHHPECFKEIEFSGNRFSIMNGFKIKELIILITQVSNLSKFQLSGLLGSIAYSENGFNQNPLFNKHRIYPTEVTVPFPQNLKKLVLRNFVGFQETIPQIPIRFMNISSLSFLDLSNFRMKYFPEVLFNGKNNLRYTDLSGIDSTLYSGRKSIPFLQKTYTLILKQARLGLTFKRGKKIFNLVPSVTKLDISYNHLWFVPNDAFNSNKNLCILNMGYNLFSEIPIAVMTLSKLSHLTLVHNSLQTINSTFRDWFDMQNKRLKTKLRLNLVGNVFKCTCENSDFILWLFHTKIIFDSKTITFKCSLVNGTITNTRRVYEEFHQLFSDCKSEIWLRVGVCLLVGFIAFTLPIAILVNFRWRIAYCIYRTFKMVVEKDMKSKFRYDIYLSCADDCLGWVKNTLIQKLENSWKMSVCIEDRDILAGNIRADAILQSIQESRNIIFIISEAFRDKIWGEFEIHRAKYEKYTRHLHKIIVITKNVSVENFPLELGFIIDDVVLLDWSDEESDNVWDKLRMTLFSEYI
ncbi:toll-like receptor 4 isoform X1 [Mytilus californianus]|uniref:toll-like receptor 4 isoform X1 n=1 Tax=Mytilus californianus TaxID=6549 RepID=UPI0022457C35|nr:toll-like receptor 4 isoform X1 [Mytilus californianus]